MTNETHIVKTRSTTLKISVDEQTRNDSKLSKKFLGTLFDFPEYSDEIEQIEKSCDVIINGDLPERTTLYNDMINILLTNGIAPEGLIGYSEKTELKPKYGTWDLDRAIRNITGISDDTSLHYTYAGSEEVNGITMYFLRFALETSGKTKNEIKTVHKENVCKLLNFLKMRKVPVSYDCEWKFVGNKACVL